MLHLYISAAQRALLNPDTPADIFVQHAHMAAGTARSRLNDSKGGTSAISRNGSASSSSGDDSEGCTALLATTAPSQAETDQLKFTRNVVVLEITGADVDLTLIDLPGIIQSDQSGDGANVELVKQLVQHYMRNERAIIVAATTCKDDIDNQVSSCAAERGPPASFACQFVAQRFARCALVQHSSALVQHSQPLLASKNACWVLRYFWSARSTEPPCKTASTWAAHVAGKPGVIECTSAQ